MPLPDSIISKVSLIPFVHHATWFGTEDGAKKVADFVDGEVRPRHDECLDQTGSVVHVDNGWASGYVVLGDVVIGR